MRDHLVYEKIHSFQAHYQAIDLEVKNYKKNLAEKTPEAKVDEAHVTLLQGQPLRNALGVRAIGPRRSTPFGLSHQTITRPLVTLLHTGTLVFVPCGLQRYHLTLEKRR